MADRVAFGQSERLRMSDLKAGFRDWRMEETPCDYCGAADSDVLLSTPDRLFGSPMTFHLVVCRKCGLARTNPRPTSESLAAAYRFAYEPPGDLARHSDPPHGLLRWALVNYRGYPPMASGRSGDAAQAASGPGPVMRFLLAPLAGLVLRRRKAAIYLPYGGEGRLLDFGCGNSEHVARMAAAGWKAEGIDLSPEAVETGRAKGLPLRVGTLPGTDLPKESFDAVTAWGTLEHVPRPLATLKAIRDVLRPGGRLLISVPGLDSLPAAWFGRAWYPLGLPLHLTHFTRATLTRHLEAAGLRVEQFIPIRSGGYVRESFRYLADDTGRWLHRRLSHSRFVVGLLSYWALLTRRASLMVALARRT